MGKSTARTQLTANIMLFKQAELAVSCSYEIGRKTNVKHAYFAKILLIVGHEHAQLQLLNGQGEVGPNDILPDIIRVVFGH